jgi:hypothetical protein
VPTAKALAAKPRPPLAPTAFAPAVVPVAAASNPESITNDEREALTRRAEFGVVK